MTCRFLNHYSLVIMVCIVSSSFSDGTLHHFYGDNAELSRVNFVVMSEGYTTGQEDRFCDDVSKIADSVIIRTPYREYRNFINIWGIFVASVDSGIDDPNKGIERDTYFDGTFNTTNRFISVYNDTAAYRLMNEHVPEYDVPVFLINDPTHTGSGGEFAKITNCRQSDYLFIHEAGHVLAKLKDEYGNSDGMSSLGRRNAISAAGQDSIPWKFALRNMAISTNPDSIPWRHWILPETPIPTPKTPEYLDVIGLFVTSVYPTRTFYRPEYDCIMRTTNAKSFCAVCTESHIYKFYSKLSPIKGVSYQDSIIDYKGEQLSLAVDTRTISPNTIRAIWMLDDTAVHRGNELRFHELALENKHYTLRVIVTDTTSMVRDPRVAEVLSDTVSWTLNVAITGTLQKNIMQPHAGITIQVNKRVLILHGLRNFAYPLAISLYTVHGSLVYSGNVSGTSYKRETLTVPMPPFSDKMYIVKVESHSASLPGVCKRVIVHR